MLGTLGINKKHGGNLRLKTKNKVKNLPSKCMSRDKLHDILLSSIFFSYHKANLIHLQGLLISGATNKLQEAVKHPKIINQRGNQWGNQQGSSTGVILSSRGLQNIKN